MAIQVDNRKSLLDALPRNTVRKVRSVLPLALELPSWHMPESRTKQLMKKAPRREPKSLPTDCRR